MTNGAFYLVSVGIGDADNITVRAANVIAKADVVFVMDFVRKQFEKMLAGKEIYEAGHCFFKSSRMNNAKPGEEDRYRHIIREAVKAGRTVAVLDFGDPGLFSPQSGYLKEFADLKPTVVPGISSFNAANAALGTDVVGGAGNAVLLTEAIRDEKLPARLAGLAASHATLVFFTMKMDMAAVVTELTKHYAAETPVAFVAQAGFAEKENVIRTTLADALEVAEKTDLGWAYLMYVGGALVQASWAD